MRSIPTICCCWSVSVNSGCPGTESSILVSSRWACPISSHVTDHWGDLRNRTGEVHPVDPFQSGHFEKITLHQSLFVGIQEFTIPRTEL